MSKNETNDGHYLEGSILIAMPSMSDPRFKKTIILLIAHNEEGAMGIVLNKNMEALSFRALLEQLEVAHEKDVGNTRVHFGGPVDTERGFVLHSTDKVHATSTVVGDGIAVTATLDMLQTMANGDGPESSFVALGYAGWGPGQLEQEIQQNGWLIVDAGPDLVFGEQLAGKWQSAIGKLGFDPGLLSSEIGHA
ncbi:MAG: YqgE/AlgH family protein [Sneathiella sp.]|nr:YqgE/AlgH family protein [Sneathiella sp.]